MLLSAFFRPPLTTTIPQNFLDIQSSNLTKLFVKFCVVQLPVCLPCSLTETHCKNAYNSARKASQNKTYHRIISHSLDSLNNMISHTDRNNDIEGKSLSQVIIYKLPFPYPDPIISCKMAEANDPLIEIAVPEMIIKLRQGIGRLIRSESDKGIVSILDPRLTSESKSRYKKVVFATIPIKNKTEDMAVLSDFWSK